MPPRPTRLSRLRVDPFLIALLATVAVATVLPARGQWAEVATGATTVAVGVLFFLYGVRLSPREAIEGARHWRLHATVLTATFVVFPLLGLAATALPESVLPHDLALGVLFLSCLPSTVQASVAFTSIARGNVPAAICAASFSNLAGVVLTPLLVGLLLHTHGGVSAGALGDIALHLLAPFALGQLLRPVVGGWVTRHRRVLNPVDRGSVLIVVYTAFGEGVVAGVWGQVPLSGLAMLLAVDAVLLAVILALTALVPRLLGFDRADRITILFCGSKKSLVTGLPMASVLIAGPTVGLVVLPLMLFHQMQLMVCAAIAQRLARRAPQPEPVAEDAGAPAVV